MHVAAPDVFLASDYRDFLNLESTGRDCIRSGFRRGLNPLSDARALFDLFVLFQIRPRYILTYTIKPVIYGSFCAFSLEYPIEFH